MFWEDQEVESRTLERQIGELVHHPRVAGTDEAESGNFGRKRDEELRQPVPDVMPTALEDFTFGNTCWCNECYIVRLASVACQLLFTVLGFMTWAPVPLRDMLRTLTKSLKHLQGSCSLVIGN